MVRVALASVLLSSLTVARFEIPASAWSCAVDPIDAFEVTVDDLASPELNDPEGPLKARWETALESAGVTADMSPNWEGPPTIAGVFVMETIAAVQEGGGWNRGSVSVVTEMWGEPPEDLRPRLHPTVDNNNNEDSCGPFGNGPQLGARKFFLVTTHGITSFKPDRGPLTVLANAFGAPVQAERDAESELELWEELRSSRPAPTGLFGFGRIETLAAAGSMALTVGALLVLIHRRRRTHTTSSGGPMIGPGKRPS